MGEPLFSCKPAYVAFATLTDALQGLQLEGAVPAPEGVLAYRFRPEGTSPLRKPVVAAWSPTENARLELPSQLPVLRVNGVGETTPLSPIGGKLSMTLKKGAPVYIVEQAR